MSQFNWLNLRLSGPSLACNAGVFWGRVNAIAAILDFKRRGRLGRAERATSEEGVSLKLQIQRGGYD